LQHRRTQPFPHTLDSELEKNFTSSSFPVAGHPKTFAIEGRLSTQPTPHGHERESRYDELLYRRKGLSGSEFAGIGLQFAVTIVVFAFAGLWLDRRLHSSPWLTVIFVFAGAGVGFWSMYRRVTHKRQAPGPTGGDR